MSLTPFAGLLNFTIAGLLNSGSCCTGASKLFWWYLGAKHTLSAVLLLLLFISCVLGL
jgi:hypothetical protein